MYITTGRRCAYANFIMSSLCGVMVYNNAFTPPIHHQHHLHDRPHQNVKYLYYQGTMRFNLHADETTHQSGGATIKFSIKIISSFNSVSRMDKIIYL